MCGGGYNSNSILKGLLKICSHEKDIEDKGRGRRGVWTLRRARTDSRSSGPELVRSARVWHLWETCMSIHRSTAVRAGVNRKRTTDCVHMRPEYFDGMQMHEDSAIMAALRWNNLWSSVFQLIQVLSMKTLQRCGLRIDPVHLIYATQPGISHTSPVHV